MNASYKLLSASDVPVMKEMLGVFAEAFADPHTYLAAVPQDAYLASLLGSERFIALAAVVDHRVVGGLTAYVLDKFEQERREVYLYDLAVAEAHRRHGIATGLIGSLKSVARQRGAYVIFVQADRGDTPAIRLYESLGKREETHNFDIPVDDGPAAGGLK